MILRVLAVNDPKILISIGMIPVCSRKTPQDGLGGLFVGRMQYFPILSRNHGKRQFLAQKQFGHCLGHVVNDLYKKDRL